MIRLVAAVLFIFVSVQTVAADVASSAYELFSERKTCIARYSEYKKYKLDFEKSIETNSENDLVEAYEDYRAVVGYWNQCWTIYSLAVLSLLDGEMKFSVVPYSLENMQKIKGVLEVKYLKMNEKVRSMEEGKAKSLLQLLISDSAREFSLLEKYSRMLSSY